MPEETSFPNPWVFDPRIRNAGDVYYIAREILVAVEHGPVVQDVLRGLGARRAEKASPLDAYVLRYVLPLNEDGSEPDVIEVVRVLRDLPGNPRVGPNHAFAANGFPITGQPKIQGGAGDDPISVRPLPAPVPAGGRAVRVAVVDTGLDRDAHILPIFRNHLRNGRHELDDVYENRSAGRIGLMGGHGTAVASIVARYADQACLSSIQVLNVAGTTDECTLALGILRARDDAAEIISMSLGGVYDGEQEPVALSEIFADLPEGTVLVAAAGNVASPQEHFYPACRSGVISVAAIDTTVSPPVPAPFSNEYSWIVVGAPGVRVHAAYVFGTWEYGRVPLDFEGYVAWSGTSFATPYVSALIAAATAPKESAADGAARVLTSLAAMPFNDYGKVFAPAPPDLVWTP
jgi:hypothetical protein